MVDRRRDSDMIHGCSSCNNGFNIEVGDKSMLSWRVEIANDECPFALGLSEDD